MRPQHRRPRWPQPSDGLISAEGSSVTFSWIRRDSCQEPGPKAKATKIPHDELSVVLATYNGERYLARQLESIKNQARQPDELVVGDDGSVDGTVEILKRFKKTAPFLVTMIHRNRFGVAMNFLLTLQAAQGNFIAFADQDDVWHPES